MLKVEKIIPGGQAIATDETGKKIFLWNALPGEEILEYQITKNKSNFSEAIATKISNPSKYRVEPKDDCFLSTSPWQIMDYDYELSQKQELVVEVFREHKIEIDKPEIVTDNKDYFYRNKMEYALYWDHESNRIKLAFHARGSHRKIKVVSSSIERPEILARAKEIIDELNANGEEARKYQSLLLRVNQNGEVSGGLYENKKPHPKFKNLQDEILERTYSYSPNGFFQINLPVYELALLEIKKYIKTNKVLDLYSGVGTIGLSVAGDKDLTLVEVDKNAFDEMVKNIIGSTWAGDGAGGTPAARRRMSSTVGEAATAGPAQKSVRNGNILAILDKSENVTNYIAPDQTVILDPPRAGCDKKLIDKLCEINPKTIIYLSCNPATQARDVKFLLEKYEIKSIKTFNFFPHTPHIENLVILSSK